MELLFEVRIWIPAGCSGSKHQASTQASRHDPLVRVGFPIRLVHLPLTAHWIARGPSLPRRSVRCERNAIARRSGSVPGRPSTLIPPSPCGWLDVDGDCEQTCKLALRRMTYRSISRLPMTYQAPTRACQLSGQLSWRREADDRMPAPARNAGTNRNRPGTAQIRAGTV